MNNKELKDLLDRGKIQDFSFDYNTKSNITKSTLDNVVKETNRHLLSKKRVWIILIKE